MAGHRGHRRSSRVPDDETFSTFGCFFAHGVPEVVAADPAGTALRWWSGGEGGFDPAGRSGSLGVGVVADIAAEIDWP